MADDDKVAQQKKLLKETFDEWFTEKKTTLDKEREEQKTRTDSEKKSGGGLLDALFGG